MEENDHTDTLRKKIILKWDIVEVNYKALKNTILGNYCCCLRVSYLRDTKIGSLYEMVFPYKTFVDSRDWIEKETRLKSKAFSLERLYN